MATVVVTFKIMPKDVETKLENIREKADQLIKEFGGEVGKVEEEPVAFGLKALKMYFTMDESLGSTEALEENIKKVHGVQSVEAIDVRRAIG